MSRIINNVIEAASIVRTKQAVTKLNAIFQAQYLLNQLENASSKDDIEEKKIILKAFTETILETI